jgi:transposase InsO family protein
LLPVDHPFTTLIIHSIHTAQLRSGVNSTLTALRDRFWIPRARQVIKKLLRKCFVCRKQSGKPYTIPDPAPLPKWRVQDSTPFSVTGVDFTGALFVKTPTKEEKVYISLFTCAATRALHLEVVEDLSEETFLKAFRRFASRKSLPRTMVSDNGSTYLPVAEVLKRLFQSTSLKEAFHRRGVEWHFIPKRAPWYGGFWERLIGLTKTVLKKVLGRAHVTLSSLQTVIVEIEAVLNVRPLTYVSSDIEDEEPLTPSHLLYGRCITSLPHPIVEDDEINDPNFGNISELTRRAQIQALILQHFWSRWKAEYLTSLREFHKTTGKNNQTIRVGEVVLIHDDSPRIKWKLAVIEDLITETTALSEQQTYVPQPARQTDPSRNYIPLKCEQISCPKQNINRKA